MPTQAELYRMRRQQAEQQAKQRKQQAAKATQHQAELRRRQQAEAMARQRRAQAARVPAPPTPPTPAYEPGRFDVSPPPTPAIVSQPPTPAIVPGGLYERALVHRGEGSPLQIARTRSADIATSFQQNVLNPFRRAFGMTSILPGNIWGGQTGDWQKYLAQIQQGLQPYGFGYGPAWGQPGGFLGGPEPAPPKPYQLGSPAYELGLIGAQMVAGKPAKVDRPTLDTGGGYGSGGGYGYTPSRYSGGGGGVRGQAAVAGGAGLVNWRIGL